VGVPKFGGSTEGHIYVAHREYLGEVTTAGNAFNTFTTLPLNPGMSQTFPWLSTIAGNFEEYEFSGLIFEFVSHSANALDSTNTALGSVMMATQYNANSPPFGDKAAMMQYDKTVSGKPSVNIVHAIECARRRTVLPEMYVRTGPVLQAPGLPQDLRLYDWGTFQLATQGMQDPCTLGELWVTYSVTLRKPKLPGSYGTSDLAGAWYTVQNQAGATLTKTLCYSDQTFNAPLIGDYNFSSYDWAQLEQYNTTGIFVQNVGSATAADRSTQLVFNNTHVGKFYRVFGWFHTGLTTSYSTSVDTTGSSFVSGLRITVGNGDASESYYGPPVQYTTSTIMNNGGDTTATYGFFELSFIVDAPNPASTPSYPVLNLRIAPNGAYGVNGVGCPQLYGFNMYITQIPGEVFAGFARTAF